MRRLSLFEFEDQRWCPPLLRNAVTGYLRLVVQMTRQVRPVIPALSELLLRSGETRILDLCSGSGGIAGQLAHGLAKRGVTARILLTDLYPDVDALRATARASRGSVEVREAPLDATRVPAGLPGLRTLFNAFHHFDPPVARSILAAAAESGRPIAVVEFIERTPLSLMGVFFSPLLVLLLAPLLRPFRWPALFFTYVVPAIPLMIFWDGLASWFRVYSVAELEALAAGAATPGYCWRAGHWPIGPLRVTYLIGNRS